MTERATTTREPTLPTGIGGPLSPEQQHQLADAYAALLPRSDRIADDISVQLLDVEERWYAEHPERAAELRASTRAHIRSGIERLAGMPDSGTRSIDLWRETGRRRAQQGVPMSVVLSAYSMGTRALWEALLEVGQLREIPATVLLHAGHLLWAGLDVQNQVLRESYRREELTRERHDPARIAEVVDGLLRGRGSEPDFATEAAGLLGLTQDADVMCLAWLPDESMPTDTSVRERLQDAGLISYWRMHGSHVLGIAPVRGDDATRVRQVMARTVRGRVGTAISRDGLAGFLTAHQNALAAAGSIPRGSDAVADIVERLPEAMLAANPGLTSLLVEETVRPLLHVSGVTRDVLLETLVAAVRHGGSATHAAEDLVCHRNTVIYRVKRIEELTGRSLDDPRDRLLLSLAAIALREDPALGGPTAALRPAT